MADEREPAPAGQRRLEKVALVVAILAFAGAGAGDIADSLAAPLFVRVLWLVAAGLVLTWFAVRRVRKDHWGRPLRWPSVGALALVLAGVSLVAFGAVLLFSPGPAPAGAVPPAAGPSTAPTSASPAPDASSVRPLETRVGQKVFVRHGGAEHLDLLPPSGDADLALDWSKGDSAGTLVASGQASLATVGTASAQACESATAAQWGKRVPVNDGALVCVDTDEDRYVVVEVLDAASDDGGNYVRVRIRYFG
ncbi:hypothetical protein GCM10010112_63110 [Actinoplanes lobatus]|uniref:Uncharacterized protein n=1 Tax=Actinoplanes lobatus TaxID=113568 RepID=A0A7W7HKE3_9ACTN|nr:hypothetical protein [Actinoplanes lobatus]MBB4752144.1 hypothetical protein [Actinoplanes lobatus]GGN84110.1 hypothetical protein GCM10010112_63110 [Actinoplanes lobatus]GIE44089.1 hypothetical protein Alo02nite_69870 [Actinoplanes lobatus]